MDEHYAKTQSAVETHFWYHGFRRFITGVLDDVCGGERNLRIADCGCGVGHTLPLLAEYGRVAGVELEPSAVTASRSYGYPVVRGDITRLPLATEAFDLAVCFDVVQCIDADVAAVRDMARAVRRGGRVVLTVAAFDTLAGDHAEVWREVRRYTPATARELAESAGLHVERVTFAFATIFPLMLVVRVAQRVLRPLRSGPSQTDIDVPWAPINIALMRLLDVEAVLSRYVPMPFGSSLIIVARKPGTP
jgi:SAM-dependent methyltransferase